MATAKEQDKTPPFLKKLVDETGITFRLGNGHEVRLTFADYTTERQREAMRHGFSQKVGDSVAGLSKGREYRLAGEVLAETIDGLKEAWNSGRGEGGGSLLVAAIARVKKLPEADVQKAYNNATAEQRKQWAKHPAVDLAVQQIRLERAQAAADTAEAEELEFSLEGEE